MAQAPVEFGLFQRAIAIHFGSPENFYVTISGSLSNIAYQSDGGITPPDYPIVSASGSEGVKQIEAKRTLTHSDSSTTYWVLWWPRFSFLTYNKPDGHCYPAETLPYGFESWDDVLRVYGGANGVISMDTNSSKVDPENPDVDVGSVNIFEPDDAGIGITWDFTTTKSPKELLTQDRAGFWGDHVQAQPIWSCTDNFTGETVTSSGGPSAVNSITPWRSSRGVNFTYTFKVKNDKKNPQLTLSIANLIANTGTAVDGTNASGSVTVSFLQLMLPVLKIFHLSQ